MARTLLLGSAAFAALIAHPVRAQDATAAVPSVAVDPQTPEQDAATADDRTTGLQDIVVTARRRSESAQTVPVAVSVVGTEALEDHQVLNAYQLVNLTPSLQVQSAQGQVGAVNFTIRGIGTAVNGTSIESSVGIVIDDVAMSRPQFGNVQFFDLERVEVLRGPQGMLFGKNAASGLVNITTAQPRLNQSEFLSNVTYGNSTAPGNGNTASLQVAGNVPIGSTAALRIAAFVNRQDAFAKSLTLRQNLGNTSLGGRAKLRWEPADGVVLTLAGDYQHSDGPGEGVLVHSYTAPGGLAATTNARNGVVASPKNTSLATNAPNTNTFDVYGASLKAEVELGGGFALTNVLAHRRYKASGLIDVDGTTANLFDMSDGRFNYRQTTEELRLSSPSTGPLSYQVGLFYLDLRASEVSLLGANLGAPAPGPGLSLLGGRLAATSPVKSYAGFFEGQYKIAESLGVTAGVRYTHDETRYIANASNPFSVLSFYGPGFTINNVIKKDNVSYRFGVDYTIAPDVLTYATYARGYKGAGFDQITGAAVAPEYPTSIELGIKSTLLDRRLRLNVALFDTKFDGFQTQAQRQGAAQGFVTLNAGKLKSRGVEVEFTALPFEGLTISGGTTYNATKYEDLPGVPCYYGQPIGTSGTGVCLPNGTTNVSGNQLANAPRWTSTVTARYEHSVSADWVGFLQGDAYHRSSFYFTQSEDPRTQVKSNAIIGLSVGVKTADDRFSVTGFVRNLFDKRIPSFIIADPVANAYVGASGVSDAALGGNYFSNFGPNSFRTIGLSLNYRM